MYTTKRTVAFYGSFFGSIINVGVQKIKPTKK